MASPRDLFPASVVARMESLVESRLQSAADLAGRGLPILPSDKVGSSADLARHLMAALHALGDQEKRELLRALGLTISDIDRGAEIS